MADPHPLPIHELRAPLREAIGSRQQARIVIEAPTGSGKSTQIPRILINDVLIPSGEVVVLQPRRMAARLLARRVAREQGCRLGEEVGYQVRFERATSDSTRIRYLTEGILLREMLADPVLPHIGALVFDEFHERHLYGDITLARALQIQESQRPDLVLLVMSATLEAEKLGSWLRPCTFLRSEGRTHPVEIRHSPPRDLREPVWEHAARVAADAAAATDGDLLVFMPGAYEIRRTLEALRHTRGLREFDLFPLHGELPPAEQDRAVEPGERRRVIVSTNVAETSLTIEGVTAVIDSGLARKAKFDSQRGINTLTVEKISQASAAQRAGRAGRTRPGICWRLWSQAEHSRRPPQELPEILRLDLAEVVLTLLASGVDDLEAFRWIEPPPPRGLEQALRLLSELGALADAPRVGQPLRLTPLGRRLVDYPLHPRHARILEEASERGAAPLFSVLLALMQGRPLFGRQSAEMPARFVQGHEFSDLQPLLRAWQAASDAGFSRDACEPLGVNALAAREAAQLARQLSSLGRRSRSVPETTADPAEIGAKTFAQILLSGFSDQVARRTSEGSLACDLTGGRRGQILRESLLRRHPLVLAAEVREIEGREVQIVLSHLTALEEEWIAESFPQDFRRVREPLWDAGQRRVLQKEQTLFRDLVLSERQSGEPDPAAAAAILAKKVLEGELRLTAWDDAVDQWIARLNCLARWMPELELPALEEADRAFVIEQLCQGAFSYKEIKERSPWNILRQWLGGQQAAWLDQHAPERVRLPDGRTAKVVYSEAAEPTFSARIQQLYDMRETPRIAAGRVPLVVSITGPNLRPLQVTKDLPGFWENHYPRLKQELQRKYPRHEWR